MIGKRREGAGRAPLPEKPQSNNRTKFTDFAARGQARLDNGNEPAPEPTAKLTISTLTAALTVLSGTRYLREFRLHSPEDKRLTEVRAELSAAIMRCRQNGRRNARRGRQS